MKQSRVMSLIEALANIVVGLAVSVVANMVVLPWVGYAVTWHESFWLAVFFTVVSLVRSYCMRRAFEWGRG